MADLKELQATVARLRAEQREIAAQWEPPPPPQTPALVVDLSEVAPPAPPPAPPPPPPPPGSRDALARWVGIDRPQLLRRHIADNGGGLRPGETLTSFYQRVCARYL